MAKKSQINRNLKRQKTVARFASRRQALKAIIRNPESSFDERQEAMAKLQAMYDELMWEDDDELVITHDNERVIIHNKTKSNHK